MAVGRQDYQAGVVPIKSGYSLNQTPYVDYDNQNVNNGVSGNFCDYTVPVGYQLVLTGIRITTTTPIVNTAYILIAGQITFAYYWDLLLIDNFPDSGSIIVNAGERIFITIFNLDTNQKSILAVLIGILEQIET